MSFHSMVTKKHRPLVFILGVLSLILVLIWYSNVLRPAVEVAEVDMATLEEVKEARELGLQWFANNFYDSKLFHYWLNPETDRLTTKNNALRQLMASRTVAEAAQHYESLLAVHRDNLEFVFKYWFEESGVDGYVYYSQKSKLGANAMLLRTLVYSPDYEQHSDKAAAVAQGIVSVQQDDGSFLPWYKEPGYFYEAEYLMYFYSGEAILALVEYADKSGDEKVLGAALKAADFYQREYVEQIDRNYHPAYVPWHTMAYGLFYELTGDEQYVESIFVMNDRLLELLDTEEYPGRFYKKELEHEGQKGPHSSSDAVYLEGLIHAYSISVEVGDQERVDKYRAAIDLALERLLSLQYREADSVFPADLESYLGAIPISETNPHIRVDTTQHFMDALGVWLEVFGE